MSTRGGARTDGTGHRTDGGQVEPAGRAVVPARSHPAPHVRRTGREALPAGQRVQGEGAVLRVAAAPVVASAVETVTGVLEEAGARGSAAWAALRAEPPAVAGRRWPWALGAAVAGAGAGAAVAYALGRLQRQDAPDALDPELVLGLVDRPSPAPPA